VSTCLVSRIEDSKYPIEQQPDDSMMMLLYIGESAGYEPVFGSPRGFNSLNYLVPEKLLLSLLVPI